MSLYIDGGIDKERQTDSYVTQWTNWGASVTQRDGSHIGPVCLH